MSLTSRNHHKMVTDSKKTQKKSEKKAKVAHQLFLVCLDQFCGSCLSSNPGGKPYYTSKLRKTQGYQLDVNRLDLETLESRPIVPTITGHIHVCSAVFNNSASTFFKRLINYPHSINSSWLSVNACWVKQSRRWRNLWTDQQAVEVDRKPSQSATNPARLGSFCLVINT